jgi:hypothetical protein
VSLDPQSLDDLYTELCNTLTEVGEAQTSALLARLCLLLMQETGDAERIRRAIRAARDALPAAHAPV